MTRIRPDALILLAAVAVGYLALSPAPRGVPDPVIPATASTDRHPGVGLVASPAPDPALRGASVANETSRIPAGSARPGHESRAAGAPTTRPSARPTVAISSPRRSARPTEQSGAQGKPASERPPRAAASLSAPRDSTTGAQPSQVAGVSKRLTGLASWFCLPGRSACTAGVSPGCLCAAAGPALRAALGPGWMGRTVLVSTRRASVPVRLVDWCACPNGRVLDLFAAAYSGLDSLGSGLINVTVEVL